MTFDEALKEVAKIKDGANKPVDSSISRVIAALMYSGFITNSSCEGHMEHGEPYPWVGIGLGFEPPRNDETIPEDVYDVGQKLQDVMSQSGFSLYSTLDVGNPKIRYFIDSSKEGSHYRVLGETSDEKAVVKINHQEQRRLIALFVDFYSTGVRPDENMLTICPGGKYGDFLLQPIGGDSLSLLPRSERIKTHDLYLSHMNEFADFLLETT